MSILRVHHTSNYTVVPNAALRDDRLSFRATGVLAYLLSLPPDSSVSAAGMSKHKAEGRDAIRTALIELVEAGYVCQTRWQDDKGRWSTVTDVYDTPQPGPGNPPPTPENPTPVEANSETQASNNQVINDVSNKGYTPEIVDSGDPVSGAPPSGGASDSFDDFWAVYPRRVAKGAARKAWDKAVKRAEPAAIVAGAIRYRDDPQRTDRYTAHPATWLNADRWDDENAPLTPSEPKSWALLREMHEEQQRDPHRVHHDPGRSNGRLPGVRVVPADRRDVESDAGAHELPGLPGGLRQADPPQLVLPVDRGVLQPGGSSQASTRAP